MYVYVRMYNTSRIILRLSAILNKYSEGDWRPAEGRRRRVRNRYGQQAGGARVIVHNKNYAFDLVIVIGNNTALL